MTKLIDTVRSKKEERREVERTGRRVRSGERRRERGPITASFHAKDCLRRLQGELGKLESLLGSGREARKAKMGFKLNRTISIFHQQEVIFLQ
jgi:hypothetical protein